MRYLGLWGCLGTILFWALMIFLFLIVCNPSK